MQFPELLLPLLTANCAISINAFFKKTTTSECQLLPFSTNRLSTLSSSAFSCASGEYLEMKNQVCSECAEGTYSLGSGIKFDEWDDLPAGFSNVATYMDSTLGSAESKADSCAK